MKCLNLPIVKVETHKAKYLSMNDYLKFVIENLKYTVDVKAGRALSKKMAVNIPFVLK